MKTLFVLSVISLFCIVFSSERQQEPNVLEFSEGIFVSPEIESKIYTSNKNYYLRVNAVKANFEGYELIYNTIDPIFDKAEVAVKGTHIKSIQNRKDTLSVKWFGKRKTNP